MKNGDQSETVNRSYFCKNDREKWYEYSVDCAYNIVLLGFWHQYITAIKTAKTDIDDAVKRAEPNFYKISTKLDNIALMYGNIKMLTD